MRFVPIIIAILGTFCALTSALNIPAGRGLVEVPAGVTVLEYAYSGSHRVNGLYLALTATDPTKGALVPTSISIRASFNPSLNLLVYDTRDSMETEAIIEILPTSYTLPQTDATLYVEVTATTNLAVSTLAVDGTFYESAYTHDIRKADAPTTMLFSACYGDAADAEFVFSSAFQGEPYVSLDASRVPGESAGLCARDGPNWDSESSTCTLHASDLAGSAMSGAALVALTIPANSLGSVVLRPAHPMLLQTGPEVHPSFHARRGCAWQAHYKARADRSPGDVLAFAAITPRDNTLFKREAFKNGEIAQPSPYYSEQMLMDLSPEPAKADLTFLVRPVSPIHWSNYDHPGAVVDALVTVQKDLTSLHHSATTATEALAAGIIRRFAVDTLTVPGEIGVDLADDSRIELAFEARAVNGAALGLPADEARRGLSLRVGQDTFSPQITGHTETFTRGAEHGLLPGSKAISFEKARSEIVGEWSVTVENMEQSAIDTVVAVGAVLISPLDADGVSAERHVTLDGQDDVFYARVDFGAVSPAALDDTNVRIRAGADISGAVTNPVFRYFASQEHRLPDRQFAQWASTSSDAAALVVPGAELARQAGNSIAPLYIAFKAAAEGTYTFDIDLIGSDVAEIDDGGRREGRLTHPSGGPATPATRARGYFQTDAWSGNQFQATHAFCTASLAPVGTDWSAFSARLCVGGDPKLTDATGTVCTDFRSPYASAYMPLRHQTDIVYYSLTHTGAGAGDIDYVLRCGSLEDFADNVDRPQGSAGELVGHMDVGLGRMSTLAPSRDPLPEFAVLAPALGPDAVAAESSTRITVGSGALVIPESITVDILLCADVIPTGFGRAEAPAECLFNTLHADGPVAHFDTDNLRAGAPLFMGIFPRNYRTAALPSMPVGFWRMPLLEPETPAPGQRLSVTPSVPTYFRTVLEPADLVQLRMTWTPETTARPTDAVAAVCISSETFYPEDDADCNVALHVSDSPEPLFSGLQAVTARVGGGDVLGRPMAVTVRVGAARPAGLPLTSYKAHLRVSDDVMPPATGGSGLSVFTPETPEKTWALHADTADQDSIFLLLPRCHDDDYLCTHAQVRIAAAPGVASPDYASAPVVTPMHAGIHYVELPATPDGRYVVAAQAAAHDLTDEAGGAADYEWMTMPATGALREFTGAEPLLRTARQSTIVRHGTNVLVESCVGALESVWHSVATAVGLVEELVPDAFTVEDSRPGNFAPIDLGPVTMHGSDFAFVSSTAAEYEVRRSDASLMAGSPWSADLVVTTAGSDFVFTVTVAGALDASPVVDLYAFDATAIDSYTGPNVRSACGLSHFEPVGHASLADLKIKDVPGGKAVTFRVPRAEVHVDAKRAHFSARFYRPAAEGQQPLGFATAPVQLTHTPTRTMQWSVLGAALVVLIVGAAATAVVCIRRARTRCAAQYEPIGASSASEAEV